MSTNNRNDILFISHGGGPMSLLGDSSHLEMVEQLQLLASQLKKPSTIIVISAHWETTQPSITYAKTPSLLYDYNGFPDQAYQIEYPAPSNQTLSERLVSALAKHNLGSQLDTRRGFDHGLFVPLKIMFPAADIPCLQLSLLNNLDPTDHIKMGEALSELKDENLLILGSGFTFHNMSAFFAPQSNDTIEKNAAFERWLIETCSDQSLSEEQRTARLIHWEQAPAARYCHPREEHLLPLHVCYGAAKSACKRFVELTILGKKTSLYLW